MTIFLVFGAKYHAPFKSFVARERYNRCDHFHHNGDLVKILLSPLTLYDLVNSVGYIVALHF